MNTSHADAPLDAPSPADETLEETLANNGVPVAPAAQDNGADLAGRTRFPFPALTHPDPPRAQPRDGCQPGSAR